MQPLGNIDMKNPKILALEDAIVCAHNAHSDGKKLVTTNGCFDILHVGHVRNLQFAKSLGDVLFVGINSDRSVQANKGLLRPIVPAIERAEVIASLSCVDYVFIFDEHTPIEWLQEMKSTFHVKGSDRTLDEVVEKDVVEENGGQIVLFPHTKIHSSTDIIKNVQSLKRFENLHKKYHRAV